MGRANCPLFAEHIILTAEHLSHSLPAFLRDDLGQQWGIPPEHRSPASVSDIILPPSNTKAPAVPPRALQRNREMESLKADASSFFSSPRSTRSRDSDKELLSGFPSVDSAPRASSSTKVSVGSKEPKSQTTVKVVEDSKASKPTPSAMVYKRVRLPPTLRKTMPMTVKIMYTV
ncbi:uncharacterized protein C8R40DRAFT_1176176 [Lentinula edodes]|uniref:uncharacterized protein n=1 Tax=Lentinula edodes TaxID=5353 RepID=UPI001E8E395B|nr:uncharacterized protein C8R40DRAFT_1176176 [Lentinula edodes]KAH7869855.1 hypothetical protein C8R40DRAFT_1176176 [Lentinula edodes]